MKRHLAFAALLAPIALAACGSSTSTSNQVQTPTPSAVALVTATPTPPPPTVAPPTPAAGGSKSGLGDTSDNPDTTYACAFEGNGAFATVAGSTKASTDVFCNVFPSEPGFTAVATVTTTKQASCYSTLSTGGATLRFYKAPTGTDGALSAICSALLAPPSAATPTSAPAASGPTPNPQGATISVTPSHARADSVVHVTLTGLTPNQNGKLNVCYANAAEQSGACDDQPGIAVGAKSYPTSDAAGNLSFDFPLEASAGKFAAATPPGDHIDLVYGELDAGTRSVGQPFVVDP